MLLFEKKTEFKNVKSDIISGDMYTQFFTINDQDNKYYYQGEMKLIDGKLKKEGYGKLWTNRFNYHGEFKNDLPDGFGIFTSNECKENLPIEFVKYYEGTLKEGEKFGVGKEIYLNNESYEGNFIKSLKNGIGTFYSSNGSVKMNGVWQNGIAIDTKDITEYWDNGNIRYKGGFNGSAWHGKGVICYPNGNICFEGEIINNKTVKGNIFNNNNVKILEGDLSENGNKVFYHERTGERFIEYKNGLFSEYTEKGNLKYEGTVYNLDILKFDNYVQDEITKFKSFNFTAIKYKKGNLYFTNTNINSKKLQYSVEYLDSSLLHGDYKEFYENGLLFKHVKYVNGNEDGEFKQFYENGKPHIETCKKGSKFIGSYKEYFNNENSSVEKSGEYIEEDGTTMLKNATIMYRGDPSKILYEGDFDKNGKFTGNGKYYYDNESNSIKYEGEFSDGKFQNTGTLYYSNGNMCYQGNWNAGRRHLNGTSYYESSGTMEYLGDWVNDEKHGHGILFNEGGEQVWDGVFHYNEIQMQAD